MSWIFLFLLIIFIQCFPGINGEQTETEIVLRWANGFRGKITLDLENEVTDGWFIILVFSDATPNLYIWLAEVVENQGDKFYILRNKPFNAELPEGIFELSFFADTSAVGGPFPTGKVFFIRGHHLFRRHQGGETSSDV